MSGELVDGALVDAVTDEAQLFAEAGDEDHQRGEAPGVAGGGAVSEHGPGSDLPQELLEGHELGAGDDIVVTALGAEGSGSLGGAVGGPVVDRHKHHVTADVRGGGVQDGVDRQDAVADRPDGKAELDLEGPESGLVEVEGRIRHRGRADLAESHAELAISGLDQGAPFEENPDLDLARVGVDREGDDLEHDVAFSSHEVLLCRYLTAKWASP